MNITSETESKAKGPEESGGDEPKSLKSGIAQINQRLLKSSHAEGRIQMGLLILGIFYTIYFARGLLLPIVIALLLSALLQPAVSFLTRFKIPNALAAILVIVLLAGVVLVVAYRIAAPASEWFDRRPYLVSQLEYKLRAFKSSLEEAKETTKKLEKLTDLEGEEEEAGEVVVKGPTLSDQIMLRVKGMAVMMGIILVLTYFLLSRGRPTLKHMAGGIQGKEEGHGEKWARIMVKVQREVALYLVTIAIINASLGALTAAAMALLQMPNPILWGVVAMTLNFVPYLGAMVTTVIIAMVSLVTFTQWSQILLPPAVFLCFTALEGQFITPTIVGKRLRLNPIAVILSLLFWGWVWGIGGMLIAVPILAAVKIVAKSTGELKPLRALIG